MPGQIICSGISVLYARESLISTRRNVSEFSFFADCADFFLFFAASQKKLFALLPFFCYLIIRLVVQFFLVRVPDRILTKKGWSNRVTMRNLYTLIFFK